MSNQSNNRGRAYEFICMQSLFEEIGKIRPVEVVQNKPYEAAKREWGRLPEGFQFLLRQSAMAAVETIFDMEPMMLEEGADVLSLKLQSDSEGRVGDVRDIVITRSDVKWEIGLSIKHNHKAAKHSRLASRLDFGKEWYDIPCSEKYWGEVKPIFEYLEESKRIGKAWRDVPNKANSIYVPLLQAFLNEVMYRYSQEKSIAYKMVEYILGEFDFYKVISVDKKCLTKIQTFNFHGTLNRKSRCVFPKIQIPPRVYLPTRIISFDFKPNSKTTLELYMDRGWQFSFRIHSAETYVMPSLKFDIQIIGMPTTVISIDCNWK